MIQEKTNQSGYPVSCPLHFSFVFTTLLYFTNVPWLRFSARGNTCLVFSYNSHLSFYRFHISTPDKKKPTCYTHETTDYIYTLRLYTKPYLLFFLMDEGKRDLCESYNMQSPATESEAQQSHTESHLQNFDNSHGEQICHKATL